MPTHQTLKDILICFFISILLFLLCFPEFLIFPKMAFYALNIEHTGAYVMTSWLYHGGIQLWDRYDQMSFVYLILTEGMLKVVQVLTAAVYWCVSPFVWDQARAFTHIFSIVLVVTNLFLRITGSYLLLRRFSSNRVVLNVSTVFLSVFFYNHFIAGGFVFQSFIPLFIHAGLNFLEKPSLNNLVLFITLSMVCLASGIVDALYIYCGVHFLFLFFLIYRFLYSSRDINGYFKGIRAEWKTHWRRYTFMALIWALIIGPYVYMAKFCLNDFYFDAEHSRIHHLWSISSYLSKVIIESHPAVSFMWEALDFSKILTFPFLGCAGIFLSMAGLILSYDKRKYVFFLGFLFLLLLGDVHSGPLYRSINDNIFVWTAHWLTILTNPFKFILRNFIDYDTKAFPFLLMPLVVMGVDAVIKQGQRPLSVRRIILLWAAVYLYAAVCFSHLGGYDRTYLIVMTVLMTFLLISLATRAAPKIKYFLLTALLILDIAACVYHIRSDYKIDKPQSIIGKPELGRVEINFQNPMVLPLMEYYDYHYYDQYENYYFLVGHLNLPGSIFHYTNMIRNLIYFDPYVYPHYKIFNYLSTALHNETISTPGLLIYDVPYAVKASDSTYASMVNNGVERDMVMVHDTSAPSVHDALPWGILKKGPQEYKAQLYQGYFDKVKKYRSDGLTLYSFPYPAGCPQYRASTFLTRDSQLLRLAVADKNSADYQELSPVQGGIISGMTFDVNNIRKGWVTAGFSTEQTDKKYSFVCYQAVTGITGVWKNEWDDLGFNYLARDNGWLVILFPYDQKWKITVDGKPVKFYRANYSFMSLPLTQGKHRVLIRYWPDTWLRQFLLVSMFLSLACLGWIMLHFLLNWV